VYKCLHGSAPAYLTDELCQVADVEARQRLRSSSSSSLIHLIVSRTRLLLSVTDLSWSPLHVSGTVCQILSLPHLLKQSSALKLTCLTFPFPVIVQCLRS